MTRPYDPTYPRELARSQAEQVPDLFYRDLFALTSTAIAGILRTRPAGLRCACGAFTFGAGVDECGRCGKRRGR